MIQKCSFINVLEVFFQEPTSIHFIREISKKINLASTSTRNNIKELLKSNLIIKKKSSPFDGFIANRDNEDFLWYKKAYNLYSLNSVAKEIINSIHPKAIVLFGSYSKGEDIESSDIDIVIISKVKKDINLSLFERKLKRTINLMIIDNLRLLDQNIQKKINNGIVLYGEI